MLRNYFKIALRAFWKNKVISLINIVGLSVGISAALVIFLLVDYHFSFDLFEPAASRIFRVDSKFGYSGDVFYNSGVTYPLGAAIKKEISGLEAVIPFRTWNDDAKIEIRTEKTTAAAIYKHETKLVYVDSDFFNMVPYHWLAGSISQALLKPYQVVLTSSRAKQYFPAFTATQLIGKTILLNDSVRMEIRGIVEDLQRNSEFTFQFFISKPTFEHTSLRSDDIDNWNNTNGATQVYLQLLPGTSPTVIQQEIAKLYARNHHPDAKDHSTAEFVLQPLRDIHFNANYNAYDAVHISVSVIYGLLAVGIFLLVLGCINFINLSTANAALRSKEIGVRKTMGSSARQLMLQFLTESFLLTMLATVASVLLTPLIMKAFAGFMPSDLHFSVIENPSLLIFIGILIIVVTLLSGFYPAMVLSRFRPVQVLKNQHNVRTGSSRNATLRKTLSVSQFVIAQLFIMATLLVSKQIHYMLTKDMGFKKDAIVHFQTNYYDTSQSKKAILFTKLLKMPGIAGVSLSSDIPSTGNTWSGTLEYHDGKKNIQMDVQQKFADSSYIKLYQLRLLAGNNLSGSDTVNQLLINETYAHLLGFRNINQAIGKRLLWSEQYIPIVGVVGDFNQKSLHEPIKPLAIGSWTKFERMFNVSMNPELAGGIAWSKTIGKIKSAFTEIYPQDDFDYRFFDEDIAKYYDQERNIATILNWSTGLAILISCLGLLGLVMYSTNQRTKEIGVRKVLGASVLQIVSLVSRDFLMLVFVAFLIAAPIAWFAMNQWLQGFAFRTGISWWIFGVSGLGMILIAILTLGFQTTRSAMANPVQSLRSE